MRGVHDERRSADKYNAWKRTRMSYSGGLPNSRVCDLSSEDTVLAEQSRHCLMQQRSASDEREFGDKYTFRVVHRQ